MKICFNRVRSASTYWGLLKEGKRHADVALLRLRLHHGLTFQQYFTQRHRFRRQRHLPGFDHRKIENFVDQLEQSATPP